MKKILLLIVSLAIMLSITGCGGNELTDEELSALVANAIISYNRDIHSDGECSAEGHRILGSTLFGNCMKVYALTMYGSYGFENDMFIKVSGTGVIPAVLTFEKNGEAYSLQGIEYPRDGAGYVKSIKRMFPHKYRPAALRHSEEQNAELSSQERAYAEKYLKSIGREAQIGEYRDLNVVLLSDLGVSDDVSNKLCCDKMLGEYPYWIGTMETLENGKRYVRSLSYDEVAGQIIYRTVEKESGEVVETFIYDAATGEKQ